MISLIKFTKKVKKCTWIFLVILSIYLAVCSAFLLSLLIFLPLLLCNSVLSVLKICFFLSFSNSIIPGESTESRSGKKDLVLNISFFDVMLNISSEKLSIRELLLLSDRKGKGLGKKTLLYIFDN